MDFSIELNEAIILTVRLISVCLLIDTFEKFLNISEYRENGIFNWKWVRQYQGFSQRRQLIRDFADFVFGGNIWFVLLGLRGMTAAYLFINPEINWVYSAGLLGLFIIGSLANFRRMPFRAEVPNRFTLLLIGALFLQSLVPSKNVSVACLWFIALQSCLSYTTAGITKLFNRDWQQGNGLFKVVNSPNLVASPIYAQIVSKYSIIAKILTYLTILIECIFPIVLLVGKPYFVMFLIWGVVFHLGNAFLIRLNNYFWAWLATYPAIIYIAQS
jgi:hypothetical protein